MKNIIFTSDELHHVEQGLYRQKNNFIGETPPIDSALQKVKAPETGSAADLALVLALAERFVAEGATADEADVIVDMHEDGSATLTAQFDWSSRLAMEAEEIDVPAEELAAKLESLRTSGFSLSIDLPTAEEAQAAIARLRASPPANVVAQAIQALKNGVGALQALDHQVGQMRGMFDDEDETIQDAVDSGEEAQDALNNAIHALETGDAKPIRVLVAIDGGLVQGGCADVPVELITLDYDCEGADDDEVYAIPQDEGGTARATRGGDDLKADPAFIDAALAAELDEEEDEDA